MRSLSSAPSFTYDMIANTWLEAAKRLNITTQQLQTAGFKVQVESFGLGNSGNRRVWNYSPLGQAPKGSTILLQVLPGSNNNQGGF